MKKQILIDGDILAYQASSSVQRDINWGDDLWTCHAFLSDAQQQFYNILDSILDAEALSGYSEFTFAFSDKDNFRKELNPLYKSNRANKRKPTCYRALVDFIKGNYNTLTIPKLEGDDVLGILATDPEFDSVIVSLDKDMKTIPCKFYNFGKDELITISEERAKYWHMYQTLVGDVTDGYTGCPKYGAVRAAKLLDSISTEYWWKAIVNAFKSQNLTEEDALLQARMSYILHKDDYDMETHKIKLWTP